MSVIRISAVFIALTMLSSSGQGQIQPIDESFDGGFQNEWYHRADRDGRFSFEDEGLSFGVYGDSIENFEGFLDLRVINLGRGGFQSMVTFEHLSFGDLCPSCPLPFDATGIVSLTHELSPASQLPDEITILAINDMQTAVDDWVLRVNRQEETVLDVHISGRSGALAFGLRYDASTNEFFVVYDDDTHDPVEAVEAGPFSYSGPFDVEHYATISFVGGYGAITNGLLDHFSFQPYSSIRGDFDGDSAINVGDIDRLLMAIVQGEDDPAYDLDGNATVDMADVAFWVHDLKKTYFGDANLDGEFNSTDLVLVFGAGEYEDNIDGNSKWSTGDWTGDVDFTSSDLVLAFQDGGYEAGPRPAIVPEPSAMRLLAAGGLALAASRRRRK